MLFLILKYYAAIAANWLVCSEERAVTQSDNCILCLLFAWWHTRILHAMWIDMDKMMSGGILYLLINKEKTPPQCELTLATASVILNLSKRIVTYHTRKIATLKRRKHWKPLISNEILDNSLQTKCPITTTSRTSGTTGIRNKNEKTTRKGDDPFRVVFIALKI